MATNLHLDERLVRQAMAMGSHRTKKAAVTQALTDYVRRLQQEKKEKFAFAWEGGLAHLKRDYSAVELQHKVSEWR